MPFPEPPAPDMNAAMPPEKPRRFPGEEECAAILVAADRTCCVCRVGSKAIQLHHIDEDRSNDDPANIAVLCTECHNQTLMKGGFGRRLDPAQVRRYKDEWNEIVAERVQAAAHASSAGEPIIGAPEQRSEDVIGRVLSEADRSPKIALRMIDAELNQEIRRILAGSGWGQGRHGWTLAQGVNRLFEIGVVSSSVAHSLTVFEDARDALVRGDPPVSQTEALSALDVGIFTYRSLTAIPLERHYVTGSKIPLFADSEGRHELKGVFGVELRSIGPRPRLPHDRIFPSTLDHFQPGMEVTWAWNNERTWGEAWYQSPETGKMTVAFGGSAEFAGLPLDDVT
jgi:hypothetical protein